MLNRHAEFSEVTAEFFYSLVISLNCKRSKFGQPVCDTFCLFNLSRSDAWTFFIEYKLQLDRENLSILVELLSA